MSLRQRLGIIVTLCALAFTSIAAPADGYWLGTLQVNPAAQLRLQLEVKNDASGCTLDSLDQSAYAIPCANVKLADNEFSFDIPAVSGRYVGKLSEDGKQLTGTWTQGQTWPLTFERQATLLPRGKQRTTAPALSPVSAADMQAVLTKDLEPLLKNGPLAAGTGVGVTIGVLRNGERQVFSFGAAKPDSLFEIGSITKTFTGLMLAQMIEQQQVTADQPVRTLLPENAVPKPGGPEITLLDLVTQRSGLPRMPTNFAPADPTNPYIDYTAERMYAFLATQGLGKSVDVQPLYSNLGFGLLGQALENRAKVDYPVLVNQLVTTPLCMKDTMVQLDATHKARFIQGHRQDLTPTSQWDLDAFAGAGALRSTADDMLNYLAAQLQPAPCKITSESPNTKTLAAAIKRSQTLQGELAPGRKIAYAWIFNVETGSHWHNGKTGGYTSHAFFNHQQRYAAIVLINVATGQQDDLELLGEHVERRLAGKRVVKFE